MDSQDAILSERKPPHHKDDPHGRLDLFGERCRDESLDVLFPFSWRIHHHTTPKLQPEIGPQMCMGRGGEMERDEDHFEYGYDSSGNLQTIAPNFLVHLVGDDPKTDAHKVVLKTNFDIKTTAIREFDFYLNESTSDVILAVQVELGPDGLHFTLRQRSTSEGPIEYIYPLKRERSFPLSQSLKQSHRFDSLTSHETLARVSIEHGRWSPLLPAVSY
ncbi:hypothetical protein K474DRAFT_1705919 [Panus rudis PR-1116 ss-1]|nr:hypothetical protein K474DRAFT_1705919 [Panus rudis PR-1116 ss-1]